MLENLINQSFAFKDVIQRYMWNDINPCPCLLLHCTLHIQFLFAKPFHKNVYIYILKFEIMLLCLLIGYTLYAVVNCYETAPEGSMHPYYIVMNLSEYIYFFIVH